VLFLPLLTLVRLLRVFSMQVLQGLLLPLPVLLLLLLWALPIRVLLVLLVILDGALRIMQFPLGALLLLLLLLLVREFAAWHCWR
jgi:hypothetical protein